MPLHLPLKPTKLFTFATPFALLLYCWLFMLIAAEFRLPSAAANEDESRSAHKLKELHAQLTVGLLPASPLQEAFLDKVVFYVARGTLSFELVQGTLVWARNQRDWPYPYFEKALRERARRAGVQI